MSDRPAERGPSGTGHDTAEPVYSLKCYLCGGSLSDPYPCPVAKDGKHV